MTGEIMLTTGGLRFRALAAGPPNGEPILLLHGFPEGAEAWLPQLEALSARGLRAVAPDLRGYGGTDAPENPSDYSIAALVADVAGLLDALGWESAHLAGHDWGALIGWPFVSQHAARVRTWTALSVGHPVALAEAVFNDPDQRRRSGYVQVFRKPGHRAEALLSADGFGRMRALYEGAIPSDIVERYVEGQSRPGRLTAALNYYRTALPDVAGAMGPVTVPTRLLWGTEDPALGATGVRATGDRVEGPYRLVELEGAGHWLQYERAAEVSEQILDHVAHQSPEPAKEN